MDLKGFVIKEANRALSKGLELDTVILWVCLRLVGELNGWAPLFIISAKRTQAHQDRLRAEWDAGNRDGMKARPAETSQHSAGRAFDVQSNPDLELYGQVALELGARWGGSFSERDPNHFDTKHGLKGV